MRIVTGWTQIASRHPLDPSDEQKKKINPDDVKKIHEEAIAALAQQKKDSPPLDKWP